MLDISKDQQLHKKAYNDYSDLDNDGKLETTYKHSIDYYGYVWGVSIGPNAYRVDLNNPGAFQTFSNLVGAYTYSDMTGVALSNVTPQ